MTFKTRANGKSSIARVMSLYVVLLSPHAVGVFDVSCRLLFNTPAEDTANFNSEKRNERTATSSAYLLTEGDAVKIKVQKHQRLVGVYDRKV